MKLRLLTLASGFVVLCSCSLAAAQPPGGFPEPPKPGQVIPPFFQDRLNLTAEQKKQLEEVQKEVDARLEKILTAEQKKSLAGMAANPFGGGGFGGGFGGGGFGGGGFGGGGFGMGSNDPRMDDVKKRIKATDEEWKVIGPKLQKILASRQVLAADARAVAVQVPTTGKETQPAEPPANPAPGTGTRPRGGFGGGPGTNAISQAQAEFRAVLDDPKHTQSELQDKVAAVRKARDKVRADLLVAQKDLVQMLTPEQEMVLVGLGYLE